MTYKETIKLVNTDLARWDQMARVWNLKGLRLLLLNKGSKFMLWWRLAGVKGMLYPLSRLMLRIRSTRYGIEIPLSVEIGEGFQIAHGVGIVVNGNARFGKYVTVCQFLTIGSTVDKAADVHDHVYIGPNVCIVDDVCIASNTFIGAGSVVTKDIPENQVWAGNPARYIKDRPVRR